MDWWLNAPTVDFAQIPPVRVRRLPGRGQPPNLPSWPTNTDRRNVRADIVHDLRDREGRWS